MTVPAQPRGPGEDEAVDGRAECKWQPSKGDRSVQPQADYGAVVTAVLHNTYGRLAGIAEENRQP